MVDRSLSQRVPLKDDSMRDRELWLYNVRSLAEVIRKRKSVDDMETMTHNGKSAMRMHRTDGDMTGLEAGERVFGIL